MTSKQIAAQYDFISSVAPARRVPWSPVALAENPEVGVLLLEAGGSGARARRCSDASQWPANLGSDRDWRVLCLNSSPHVNGRSTSALSMGKVLGGGSGIHDDGLGPRSSERLDDFAAEAGDKSRATISRYSTSDRRMEGHGTADRIVHMTAAPVV